MKITIDNNEPIESQEVLFVAATDEQAIATISNEMHFGKAMHLLGTLTLHLLNSFAANHPEAKEDLYQAFNYQASNVLAAFIPDRELRPDLTAEAISRMEDQLIDEKFSKINRENRRSAKKAYKKVLKHYEKKLR
jgi:hypothetical protein